MAQVKLVEIAERLWRITNIAMPKLPGGIQVAFKLPLGTGDVSWALALVLAGWGLLKKGDEPTRAALQETGVLPLVSQIEGVTTLLPAAFQQFVDAADRATDESAYAGAAVYLTVALTDMMDLQRNAIVAWLNGVQFREAGRALSNRYPPPGSGIPSTWGGVPDSPMTQPTVQPSRSDRFDRADRPRPRPAAAGRATTATQADKPAPPTPQLSTEDIARAHLHTRGWDVDGANRLLSGPAGETGSFLQVRRILKTYGSLPVSERMLFQKLVDASEQGFTKEEMQAVATDDLKDVRRAQALSATRAIELFQSYRPLVVRDRQRIGKYILQNETRFTPEEMNRVSLAGIDLKGGL